MRDGKTGLLFDVSDAAALRSALEHAMGDPSLMASAAMSNRALVEQKGDRTRNMERMAGLIEGAGASS